ncbi:unnamed protein product, partial [marine sediment metagenome]
PPATNAHKIREARAKIRKKKKAGSIKIRLSGLRKKGIKS